MATCRSCRADIEFVRTPANRAMPLDAQPSPDGNVRLVNGQAHVLGPLEVAALTDDERAQLRMPHHATCPQGAEWKVDHR